MAGWQRPKITIKRECTFSRDIPNDFNRFYATGTKRCQRSTFSCSQRLGKWVNVQSREWPWIWIGIAPSPEVELPACVTHHWDIEGETTRQGQARTIAKSPERSFNGNRPQHFALECASHAESRPKVEREWVLARWPAGQNPFGNRV